jgi:xanthine/CO dehydrogenase XdhC/CoxF family maturation factor
VAAAVVVASPDSALPPGAIILSEGHAGGRPVPLPLQDGIQNLLTRALASGRPSALGGHAEALRVLALPLALPPRLLLLGGAPDAQPLVDLAARLGWHVTVHDHRSAYAQPVRFPLAEQVLLGRPETVAQTLDLERFDAVVVMSHHLTSDLVYLRALSTSRIPYIGLLGPANRRAKLLAELGNDAAGLTGRLHAPIGLNIGGRAPESIALSIVAQIHAWLHGAPGGPFEGRDHNAHERN